MIRKIFSATVASAAIFVAGPAIAGPGHSGGPPAGHPGGGPKADTLSGPMGAAHANPNSSLNRLDTTITTNPAVGVSQGPAHASINGIANANSRSVLGAGSVQSTTLPGLTTGLSVQNSSGTTIGSISQIVTDRSGNIRLVIVTDSSTGQTFRLAPNTLSISGTTVTTTSTVGG